MDQPTGDRADDERYLKLVEDALFLAWRERPLKAERLLRWVPTPSMSSRWGLKRTRAMIDIAARPWEIAVRARGGSPEADPWCYCP